MIYYNIDTTIKVVWGLLLAQFHQVREEISRTGCAAGKKQHWRLTKSGKWCFYWQYFPNSDWKSYLFIAFIFVIKFKFSSSYLVSLSSSLFFPKFLYPHLISTMPTTEARTTLWVALDVNVSFLKCYSISDHTLASLGKPRRYYSLPSLFSP